MVAEYIRVYKITVYHMPYMNYKQSQIGFEGGMIDGHKTFVMVAVTNTVWNPWSPGFEARFFNGARNFRMSGPKPWSNIVSASSRTCKRKKMRTRQLGEQWTCHNMVTICWTNLITYQILDITVNHVTILDMIQDPSRSTNNHVNRHVQRIFLGSYAGASTNHRWPETRMMADGFCNTIDLQFEQCALSSGATKIIASLQENNLIMTNLLG